MGAPKGNKYALGNNGGRPPYYKTPEEMQEKINDYFNSFLQEEKSHPFGHRPTVTGLSLFLGFCDKNALYDYKRKKEFTHLIKLAISVVEMNYEMLLESKSSTGAIFALKNMGWKDRTENVHTLKEQPLLLDE